MQFFPAVSLKILGYAANISIQEVVDMTNKKRTEVGLSTLNYNAQLSAAAKAKGEHMLQNDYWAHIAPDGTEPWKFFNDSGYSYRYAGENLARDFSSAAAAIDAWMASPSHKDNMLSSKYREIGIAVVEGDLNGVDTTIIVQLFGTQLVDTTPQVPIAQVQANTQVSATLTPTAAVLTLTPTVVLTASPAPTVPVSTPIPTPTETLPPSFVASGGSGQDSSGLSGILISPFNTTRSVSLFTIVALLGVMIIDGVLTHKRKVARIGGRTFAHIAFLGMVLAVILIAKAGRII